VVTSVPWQLASSRASMDADDRSAVGAG
jgi:hypothetical protein